MSETLQQIKTLSTIIVNLMETNDLPPAKRDSTDARSGRRSTHHQLALLSGIGTKLSGEFALKRANGHTPEHYHCFVGGVVNVHLRDGATPDMVRDGKTPLDVEIAAVIVRGKNGRIEDRNVYLNVRPATMPGTPAKILTTHFWESVPKHGAEIYLGRRSAVAIRPASDF